MQFVLIVNLIEMDNGHHLRLCRTMAAQRYIRSSLPGTDRPPSASKGSPWRDCNKRKAHPVRLGGLFCSSKWGLLALLRKATAKPLGLLDETTFSPPGSPWRAFLCAWSPQPITSRISEQATAAPATAIPSRTGLAN